MNYNPNINAGDLRTRIRIQYKKKTGTGSFATSEWVDLGNENAQQPEKYIFAKWVNVHGSEAWAANSMQAERAATVTIRYNSAVNETHTILLNGVRYQIVSIDNIGQMNHWLEIKVKAAVNG